MGIDTNGDEVAASLAAAAGQLDAAIRGAVTRAGALLLTTIRKNASTGYHQGGRDARGRYTSIRAGYRGHIPGTGPGPNVVTGDYRRSWRMDVLRGPDGPSAWVNTNAPQAWRLEKGFVGVDSLGRTYAQPAYPHVAPAVAAVEPVFLADLEAVIDQAARGEQAARGAVTGRVDGPTSIPGGN